MDITDVATMLSNYAFPVVVCLIMFSKLDKEREDHKAEVQEMTKAVQNNNTLLEKILTKLGGSDA